MKLKPSVAGEEATREVRTSIDELAREGAQRMLAAALEAEVVGFVERHREARDATGNRLVVRNGYMPSRDVITGAGTVEVKQPRVRDRRGATDPEAIKFTSSILPRYLRRSKNMDELIPWLYLRGISTGQFQPALEALLGSEAKGLSASTITRLTATWSEEYDAWRKRDLQGKEYVYLWADGIYFNIRLDDERQCMLVVMGATKDGQKELVGLIDGVRESKASWRELLVELRSRGLEKPPRIAVGDGALGFWAALREVFPTTKEQRCWVHKTANILNKLPKSVQPKAKADLHEIWMAETKKEAETAFDRFVVKYTDKYPAATSCLEKDREALLSFYDFPAEHWRHLRTTNPIESTFATVRLRHRKTKGSGSRQACLAMAFKLTKIAESGWRTLNGAQQLLRLLAGYKFVDGKLDERNAA